MRVTFVRGGKLIKSLTKNKEYEVIKTMEI